jgi:hypothetical protein
VQVVAHIEVAPAGGAVACGLDGHGLNPVLDVA